MSLRERGFDERYVAADALISTTVEAQRAGKIAVITAWQDCLEELKKLNIAFYKPLDIDLIITDYV